MDRILKFYLNLATQFEMILFVFMKTFLFVSHVSVKNTTCQINYLMSFYKFDSDQHAFIETAEFSYA